MKRPLLAGASKGNEMLWPQQEASVHSKSLLVIPDLKSAMRTEGEVMRNVKSTPEVRCSNSS